MSQEYLLTQDQLDLKQLAREFAENELQPVVRQCDIDGTFPMEVYKKAHEIGLSAAMFVPEEYGGLGLDILTACIIREELARIDAGFQVTIGSCGLSFTPLLLVGTDKQKKIAADILVNGGFGSYALTEPDGGSDAAHPSTTAVKVGDEWVINGRKCFITNAPLASYFIVFAATDKTAGPAGVTAFLVEREREGVSIGRHEDKIGIRLSQTSDVIFDNVHVPADHMIGQEGKGFKLAMSTLNLTRPGGSSAAVGIMQRCIDECIKYSKERVVFGKPISKQQAVAFMIADMEIKTQVARQMVHYCARTAQSGVSDRLIGAAAKCFCGDSVVEIATNAVQVFGGYGYSRDYPVEKLMRDAKIYQIFEGTCQIQRLTISGILLK